MSELSADDTVACIDLQEYVRIARQEPGAAVFDHRAAHGHTRATFDVDFLVAKEIRDEWRRRLLERGFQVISETSAFAQFSPPDQSTGLDLMFVAKPSFEQFWLRQNRRNSEQQPLKFLRWITCWP